MICAGHQPGLALISTQHTPRPSSAATAGAAAGQFNDISYNLILGAFCMGLCYGINNNYAQPVYFAP